MSISSSDRIVIPPEVLISSVGDESVLLNVKTERYYGLNAVGSRMWELLTTSDSMGSAFCQLVSEFDVEAETLERDLTEFVQKLLSNGLVEIASK